MWMVVLGSCGDYGSEFNNSSAGSLLNGGKLRPLMPRPTTTTTANSITSSNKTLCPIPNPNSSNCTRIHKANLSTLNGNSAAATIKDETKLYTIPAVPIVTRRWSPTAEQLHALKEMYRRGIRSPKTEEIHQIAANLRRFGKVEGKNVFYWFQNHKARERQRRRRMVFNTPNCEEQPQRDVQTLERKIPGLGGTGFEIGKTNYKSNSPNCSTLSEDSVSVLKTAVSGEGTVGWIQFNKEIELQQIVKTRTETVLPNWKLMNPYSPPPIHTTNSTGTTQEALGVDKFDAERRDNETLQLFPIRSSDDHDRSVQCMNMEGQPMAATQASFATNQIFEFLPTTAKKLTYIDNSVVTELSLKMCS